MKYESTIAPATLSFLRALTKNNQRDWFNLHKADYQAALDNVEAFVEELIRAMNIHDALEPTSAKDSLFRIYRDVRFSKDKSPYHTRFACGLQRLGKLRRGGYYVHIAPGSSYVACGFFGPNPADMQRIREDIVANYKTWEKIISVPAIKKTFGSMQGEQLTTAPRGYDQHHPAIVLLRHKQFLFQRDFSDAEVTAENFATQVSQTFKAIRPYFDYMSEVLTTNANGESLVQ